MNWLHAGRWLLPWICSLLIAATVAYGAEQGLTRMRVPEPDRVAITDDGAQWVVLSSDDPTGAGKRVAACLTTTGLFAADVIQVAPADLDRIVASLPCHMLSESAQ